VRLTPFRDVFSVKRTLEQYASPCLSTCLCFVISLMCASPAGLYSSFRTRKHGCTSKFSLKLRRKLVGSQFGSSFTLKKKTLATASCVTWSRQGIEVTRRVSHSACCDSLTCSGFPVVLLRVVCVGPALCAATSAVKGTCVPYSDTGSLPLVDVLQAKGFGRCSGFDLPLFNAESCVACCRFTSDRVWVDGVLPRRQRVLPVVRHERRVRHPATNGTTIQRRNQRNVTRMNRATTTVGFFRSSGLFLFADSKHRTTPLPDRHATLPLPGGPFLPFRWTRPRHEGKSQQIQICRGGSGLGGRGRRGCGL
jgi:hypothetical protein